MTQSALHALNPTRSEDVSRNVFGGAKFAQNELVLVDGQGAMLHPRAGRDNRHRASSINRGVVSHVRAQADGMASFLTGHRRSICHVFTTNIFDEASMWVQKPAPTEFTVPADAALFDRHIEKWVGTKGKNVHLPVLNQCETLFVRSAPDLGDLLVSVMQGCEVHSPAQPLPAANAATLRDRWCQWSVMTARGAGAKVTASSSLAEAVRQAPWRTIVVSRDNLVVNNCLMCLEEEVVGAARALDDDQNTDRDITMISFNCCCHSAVLAMKPMFTCLDDVPAKLVKLAHILESGRVSSSYLEQIAAVIDEPGNFRYRECVRLPADSAAWRAKATRVLHGSRPALDLTPVQEEHILCADNGDWDDEVITHYCVRGQCTLQCNGSAARSRKLVKGAIMLSIGGPMCVPLLYRWKGFEKAVAWAWRAVRQHRLLIRAWSKVFPAQRVRPRYNNPTKPYYPMCSAIAYINIRRRTHQSTCITSLMIGMIGNISQPTDK